MEEGDEKIDLTLRKREDELVSPDGGTFKAAGRAEKGVSKG